MDIRRGKVWIIARKIGIRFIGAIVALAVIFTILALEEGWRARRALALYERFLRSQGERLDLESFVPPPVPEDKNFAMAPVITALIKATDTEPNQKSKLPDSPLAQLNLNTAGDYSTLMPKSASSDVGKPTDLVAWQRYLQNDESQNPAADRREAANAVLLWLGRWSSPLDEFSAAAARPYARFPLDYSKGINMPIPHARFLSRIPPIYRLRAIAALETGDGVLALNDLQTLDRFQQSVRSEPLLISYLVRSVVLLQEIQPIWEGCVNHRWTEEQLREIDRMMAQTDILVDYVSVIRGERAMSNLTYEGFRRQGGRLGSIISDYLPWLDSLPKEAIMSRNQLANERWVQEDVLPIFDTAAHRIHLSKQRESERILDEMRTSPYNIVFKIGAPSIFSLANRTAVLQVAIDEAHVACALERYRLRNERFPNVLDELVPQYLAAIPSDVIDGQPLRYKTLPDQSYVLYSIGWNEVDDGAVIVRKRGGQGSRDNERGDWVWFGSVQN